VDKLLQHVRAKIDLLKIKEGRITTAAMEAELKLPKAEIERMLTKLGYEEIYIKASPRIVHRIWVPITQERQAASVKR
jgi:ribosomal protein L9